MAGACLREAVVRVKALMLRSFASARAGKPGHDEANRRVQREASWPTTRLSILESIGFCSSPNDLRAAVRTMSEV